MFDMFNMHKLIKDALYKRQKVVTLSAFLKLFWYFHLIYIVKECERQVIDITEKEFDSMIKRALDNNPNYNILDIEYDYTPVKHSRKTKKAIKKIARGLRKKNIPNLSARAKLRYAVVAIIGASLLTVGAYAYCSKYVFTMGDAKMEYVAVESTVSDKTSIEEVYELTYNLDGYKLTSYSEDESGVSTCYKKGAHHVRLSQYLISSDDTLVNTENAIIETIDINGEEAIYIDSSTEYDDAQMLIWTYGGYEFYIDCQASLGNRELSKEQLIQMAESIEIKD